MMTRARTWVFLAAAAAASASGGPARAAIDGNAGTSGGAFMKLGAGSPRAAALGRAFAALAEGPDALVWNPAGIALSRQREVAFGSLDWVQGMSAQYVGYVHPFGRTVLGANLAYFSIAGFDVRDAQGIGLGGGNVRVRDAFATVSVAHSFLYEKLFVGISVKNVHEDNAGPKTDTVVEDLGVLVRPSRLVSVGASYQNFSSNDRRIAATQRLGLALHPSEFMNVSVEVSDDSDNRSRAGVGLELLLPEEYLQVGEVAFRVGAFDSDPHGQNRDDKLVDSLNLQRTSGVSFGVGLYSSELVGYGLGLDYAVVPMGALGVSHQFLVRARF